MSDTSHKRKLAAVLFADMVGYTELSQQDEALALELVQELRNVVSSAAAEHGGRVIKTMGDGFLLTFESGLDAVRCARAAQAALAEQSEKAAPGKRYQIRVGLHLGDVEEREGDVFGNGVNLAARVLTVAAPGEVCMTQPVYDQLDPETRAPVVDRGTRLLKNMPHAVRIYAIGAISAPIRPRRRRPSRLARVAVGAPVLLALVAGVFWIGRDLLPLPRSTHSAGKILLAVLPLNNVNHDAELADIAVGLVETLTGELAERVATVQAGLHIIPWSEVLARKIGTPTEAVDFFGVNRVLTGSVQRQGQQVKVVLTLEDAANHKAINSASKVGQMDNPFVLQDELVDAVVSLLDLDSPTPLLQAPRAARTDNGHAYLAYLKGLEPLARFDLEPELQKARTQFEEAIKLDSGFVLAHARLAEACWRLFDRTGDPKWKDRAETEAATLGNADLPVVHAVLGLIDTKTGKFDKAIAEYQRAAESDPASPDAQLGLAQAYANSRRDEEAERTFLHAIKLSTNYWAGYNHLGSFYLSRGRYDKAEHYYLRAAEVTPDNYLVACNLGGLYCYMGRNAEARKALRRSIDLHPNADAYSNLGTLEFAERNYPAAGEHFEQAIHLGANEPAVWGNLADAWRLAGKPTTEVTATYQRALDLIQVCLLVNPQDALRRAQLAYYLAHVGKPVEAIEAIGQARQLSPQDVNVTFTAALVYERAGQRAEALEALRQAAAGGYSPSDILGSPDLAGLRLDPGFPGIKDCLNPQKQQPK